VSVNRVSPSATLQTKLAPALWSAMLFLTLVGGVIVAARLTYPDDFGIRLEPYRVRTINTLGLPDPAAATRVIDLRRFEAHFAEHHALTRWHILTGALFLFLAPFQLARRARARYPTIHRWTGRVALVSGCVAAITGLYFGVVMPIAGVAESTIITLVSSLFLFSVIRAFRAIRRGDTVTHREWMLRAVGVMVAVPATRVVGTGFAIALLPTGIATPTLLAIDIWVTWIVVIGVTEWWILSGRRFS
jgi:uncharacterized membrane protein